MISWTDDRPKRSSAVFNNLILVSVVNKESARILLPLQQVLQIRRNLDLGTGKSQAVLLTSVASGFAWSK